MTDSEFIIVNFFATDTRIRVTPSPPAAVDRLIEIGRSRRCRQRRRRTLTSDDSDSGTR